MLPVASNRRRSYHVNRSGEINGCPSDPPEIPEEGLIEIKLPIFDFKQGAAS